MTVRVSRVASVSTADTESLVRVTEEDDSLSVGFEDISCNDFLLHLVAPTTTVKGCRGCDGCGVGGLDANEDFSESCDV